ncbi:hypothetical protein [Martelella radicis]|uniref:Uncharacterized protein n=1 Tax=Martelella radicis TaxID=1397476 RepID=A0A7W6KKV6_9HYPH|nr:hypothetical protein [Martelella radicis]MBB4121700.1 hypothetical protein [Martelella radicis]
MPPRTITFRRSPVAQAVEDAIAKLLAQSGQTGQISGRIQGSGVTMTAPDRNRGSEILRKYRVALAVVLSVVASLGLSSCSTTCGDPDVCTEIAPAYQQMSDEDISTMTEKMDGLAGVSARQ